MQALRGLAKAAGLLLLLSSSLSVAQPALMPLIYGGNTVAPHHAEWAVELFVFSHHENGNSVGGVCGGALINHQHVLTAAHCVYGQTAQDIYLNIGDINTPATIRDYSHRAAQVFVHPLYKGSHDSYRHDIALIKLTEAAPSYLQTIPIHHRLPTQTNAKVTAYGWGETENGALSDVLLSTTLEYIPAEACSWEISQSSFCAVSPDAALNTSPYGNDACIGDSGGPLTYHVSGTEMLLGITSYGARACGTHPMRNFDGDPNTLPIPGVYIRPAYYQQWIDCVKTQETSCTSEGDHEARMELEDRNGGIGGWAFLLLTSLFIWRSTRVRI